MQETIDIVEDKVKAHLTVRQAEFGDKLYRDMLAGMALEKPNADSFFQTFAAVVHPRAVACLAEDSQIGYTDGTVVLARNLSAKELYSLPPAIGEAWLNLVYKINPTWTPGYGLTQTDLGQKKT